MCKNIEGGGDTVENMALGRRMLEFLRLQILTLSLCNIHCLQPQQWLHERASMLPYTYIACLVLFRESTL